MYNKLALDVFGVPEISVEASEPGRVSSVCLSGGGQETGQNAVGAVMEEFAREKCCVRERCLLQRRKCWTTRPAPHHDLQSQSPATTTPAHLSGTRSTGQRYTNSHTNFYLWCHLVFLICHCLPFAVYSCLWSGIQVQSDFM